MRLTPERLAGPANRYEVRACVSADAAQVMNSQVAFFCFSLAVRLYNHVGYLINAGGDPRLSPTPAFVARLLNRGGRYYSLGMRAYYLSVPLVFWLFGPWYLVISACGVVAVLFHVDRAPALAVAREGECRPASAEPESRAADTQQVDVEPARPNLAWAARSS